MNKCPRCNGELENSFFGMVKCKRCGRMFNAGYKGNDEKERLA